MIKIEKAEVLGWEHAIRGMRNPLNSWEKSDSKGSNIGQADMELMQKLARAGTDHRKFMRMIVVYADITAPLYWYKQFDTYKVGTVANSTSTMHKIHDKEFTLDDFSCEHLTNGYEGTLFISSKNILENVVNHLNFMRELYSENKDKKYWYRMIQLLPSSYNQKRTVKLNYEVLYKMYHSRKNHKLNEWKDFCEWVETLPYANELICKE